VGIILLMQGLTGLDWGDSISLAAELPDGRGEGEVSRGIRGLRIDADLGYLNQRAKSADHRWRGIGAMKIASVADVKAHFSVCLKDHFAFGRI
jgi:hypothetical protein